MTQRRGMDTPFGPLTVEARDGVLTAIRFEACDSADDTPLLRDAIRQLTEYFAQQRRDFGLPLAPAATPFQDKLRHAMCAIPYGETRSYADLARDLASAPRAVGQGCGRNPLPIIVPCHRVVAATGQLGGFSAGDGPATKHQLLTHESAQLGLAV
jgi:methylated-DNA-[protein]-cysteine S-methyltransferase